MVFLFRQALLSDFLFRQAPAIRSIASSPRGPVGCFAGVLSALVSRRPRRAVPSNPARRALRAIQLFRSWRDSMNRPGARIMPGRSLFIRVVASGLARANSSFRVPSGTGASRWGAAGPRDLRSRFVADQRCFGRASGSASERGERCGPVAGGRRRAAMGRTQPRRAGKDHYAR